MIGNLLPFMMLGIFIAAVLAKPLARQRLVAMPVALLLLGFLSSEIWVALGNDTGLRWEILRDLVFYLLLPMLIFEASININVRHLRREALLVFSMAVPLLLVVQTHHHNRVCISPQITLYKVRGRLLSLCSYKIWKKVVRAVSTSQLTEQI